jgi:hypothetical protein
VNVRLPDVQPQALAAAIKANKHYASVLAVLLLVLAAFPGSPARSLIQDIVSGEPAPTAPVAAPAAGLPAPLPALGPGALPSFTPATPGPDPARPSAPALVDPLDLPPAEPLPPAPVCGTDAVADLLDEVRGPLSELLGQPVPGASVRKLAAIATGCGDADPTTAVLDLALEVAAFVPPTGLDLIDLPDLPGFDIPAGPELAGLLAPLAPAIREGCANLATIALVFVVLPPAFSLPFAQSDLIQFLGPATSLCALFDEEAP